MKFLEFSLMLIAVVATSVTSSDESSKKCDDGLGVCTRNERCDENKYEFTNGATVLDSRFDDSEEESCHYMEVCCRPEHVISDEDISEIPLPKKETEVGNDPMDPFSENDKERQSSIETTRGSCNSETHACVAQNFCHDGVDYVSVLLNPRMEEEECEVNTHVCCEKNKIITQCAPSECGIHNKDGIGIHITNNVDESQFGEFPWVAALLQKSDSGDSYNYFCAGSLIHPNVVLTAAHCVNGKDISGLKVRLGEWDTQTTNEPMPHVERGVSSIEIHEEFDSQSLINDVALITLSSKVPLALHINTICLPPSNVKFDHDMCIGTGWGKDNFESKAYRANLKRVDVPVVPVVDCQSKLRQTELTENFKLSVMFMCAGGEAGKDTCTGDGGAPLVCPNPKKENGFYQAGIVAWGVECGQENVPGVYANVAKARQWIDGKMNEYGYGSESYTPK